LLQFSKLIDELERDELDGTSLAEELRVLHHLKARFDAQVARRVDAFDRAVEWRSDQSGSAAAWLRTHCRLSEPEARATVRRAKQVRAMPWVAECWAAGAINTSHVDVIAGARHGARDNEAFAVYEEQFANVALHGSPEDVHRVARQWRDALDAHRQPEATQAVQDYESREFYLSQTFRGRWVFKGTLDAEAGSYVERAIAQVYERQHKADDERTPAQQRADAFTTVFAEHLERAPRGSNRPHVMVLGDVHTITGDAVGLCETDTGTQLSAATLRRMACDSLMCTAAVNAEGVVLDMGRSVRTFTPEQARALQAQYPTCVVPGCAVPSSKCENHHADWWEHGGPTDLGNGAPVCKHDHHLFHEYRWTMTRHPDTGIVEIFKPDGALAGTTYPRRRPDPIPIKPRAASVAG
jgi:hypothetical protein